MRHYATACRDWQLRPLVASMLRHCQPFKLHVLAWDWTPGSLFDLESADGPQRQHGTEVDVTVQPVFLARHPELRNLPGEPRNPTDTVCSVRWSFVLDVMRQTGQPVTLIDGDLFAFGPPDEIFEEIGDAPMAVVPHRIPPAARGLPGVTYETHSVYNEFNGGFTYWADLEPLREMAEMARAWCYTTVRNHPVDGRPDFGDQGVLQRVAERHGAHVIQNPAAAPGPWNIHNEILARGEDGVISFGGRRLCFYHFSSLRIRGDGSLLQFADAHYDIAAEQIRILYDPYVREVTGYGGQG